MEMVWFLLISSFFFIHWVIVSSNSFISIPLSLKSDGETRLFLIFKQAVATKLDLPDDLVGYFSLFLVREGVDGGLTCKSKHQFPKNESNTEN